MAQHLLYYIYMEMSPLQSYGTRIIYDSTAFLCQGMKWNDNLIWLESMEWNSDIEVWMNAFGQSMTKWSEKRRDIDDRKLSEVVEKHTYLYFISVHIPILLYKFYYYMSLDVLTLTRTHNIIYTRARNLRPNCHCRCY